MESRLTASGGGRDGGGGIGKKEKRLMDSDKVWMDEGRGV